MVKWRTNSLNNPDFNSQFTIYHSQLHKLTAIFTYQFINLYSMKLNLTPYSLRLITLLSFSSVSFYGFGQADTGFSNKADAKNQMVNGKKEGKWVEYLAQNNDNGNWEPSTDANAPKYILITYKNGKAEGLAKQYNKMFGGTLEFTTPYVNGMKNGVEKHYEGGDGNTVTGLYTFVNDTETGTEKHYYPDGKNIEFEYSYANGVKNGAAKEYYENGKIKTEMTYNRGAIIAMKKYDENGNVVK